MKHQINSSDNLLPSEVDLFICSNGFEERWKKILLTTHCKYAKEIYLIERFNSSSHSDVNYQGVDIENITIVDVLDSDQVTQWNNIFTKITSKIQSMNEAKVVIDITCIPQLTLYAIICQLHLLNLNKNITFTYSGASKYNIESISSSDSSINRLSTVLGYPGVSTPSCNKQHLILLVGFDFDLAKTLIRDLEPTSISLGLGNSAFQGEFHEINSKYLKKIKNFASTQVAEGKITTFEFSCSDYQDAKESISKEIIKHNDKNIVMCSMNTKVSSIASAKSALENDSVKMCHIEPIFRSISDYSKDSDMISIFSL
ncbi:conserved hypothetical protein [Vibrio jasicida]|uniref:Uncharacterized protein n=1 Tax=Vibrio jasicida TaxID=766224 RepID=A0AAU9QYK9_9VIBR|nr:conserved hypothetical protein [Vibrio jasicida]CAH1602631.1 conserved hypothetical protein [Vibrio jasicida]